MVQINTSPIFQDKDLPVTVVLKNKWEITTFSAKVLYAKKATDKLYFKINNLCLPATKVHGLFVNGVFMELRTNKGAIGGVEWIC